MKALKVLWGLLVDDARLASILLISLVVAFIVSLMGMKLLGAIIIWVGLVVSVWASVEHQLKLKLSKMRS